MARPRAFTTFPPSSRRAAMLEVIKIMGHDRPKSVKGRIWDAKADY